jgi:hypothetical protein
MGAVDKISSPLWVVILCVGLVMGGCGEGQDTETVFLYVTNGYPGTSSLTLYGPTGKLATGLPFGSRTEEAIEVERNVNSEDFVLVLDGAPVPIEFTKPMFSLFPQETGTMLISRRGSEEAADVMLYRHTRTPSPDCVINFDNALSLDNNGMGDSLGYAYQTEWNVDPSGFYDESREQYASTRCGPTAVLDEYKRPDVHTNIRNDPWLVPVEVADGYGLVWARRRPDPRTDFQRSDGFGLDGQVIAHPHTRDFMDCVSGAVTIAQEVDPTGGLPSAGEQECPTPTGDNVTLPNGESVTLYGPDEVVWNDEAVAQCHELFTYNGYPIEPASPDTYQGFLHRPRTGADPDNPDDLVCGFPVRVRTPLQDLIFQTHDSSGDNFTDGVGGWIEVDAFFPPGEQRFFVIFGRPIDAFIDQWNGGETSVKLDDYPYPGDVHPSGE